MFGLFFAALVAGCSTTALDGPLRTHGDEGVASQEEGPVRAILNAVRIYRGSGCLWVEVDLDAVDVEGRFRLATVSRFPDGAEVRWFSRLRWPKNRLHMNYVNESYRLDNRAEFISLSQVVLPNDKSSTLIYDDQVWGSIHLAYETTPGRARPLSFGAWRHKVTSLPLTVREGEEIIVAEWVDAERSEIARISLEIIGAQPPRDAGGPGAARSDPMGAKGHGE